MIDDGVNLWRRILDWIGYIWMMCGWYHIDIIQISPTYHPHFIQILSRYHSHIIQISATYHADIIHISSRYHPHINPHIIQISPTYHPDITHISSKYHPVNIFYNPPTWWKVEFKPWFGTTIAGENTAIKLN